MARREMKGENLRLDTDWNKKKLLRSTGGTKMLEVELFFLKRSFLPLWEGEDSEGYRFHVR